jgi:hypothetical protein
MASKWKEPIVIYTYDEKVIFSDMRWMTDKRITEIVKWCKQYRIAWEVTQ